MFQPGQCLLCMQMMEVTVLRAVHPKCPLTDFEGEYQNIIYKRCLGSCKPLGC